MLNTDAMNDYFWLTDDKINTFRNPIDGWGCVKLNYNFSVTYEYLFSQCRRKRFCNSSTRKTSMCVIKGVLLSNKVFCYHFLITLKRDTTLFDISYIQSNTENRRMIYYKKRHIFCNIFFWKNDTKLLACFRKKF